MYALVDCNNFYASCERVFNPSLRNRAIVVLSNNDGCVIARTNEAKAAGVKMGQPAFEIKDLIKQFDIKVFSSNYTLYGDMSQRVMNTLSEFTPEIEIYSIDEAFLCFKGFQFFNINDYASTIRKTVIKNTGIPVSVGIASSKTLSKLANHYAKKVAKNNGVFVITEQNHIEALKGFEISDVWGIGRQYSKLLYKHNVKTAFDFVNLPDDWIRKNLSVVGLRTKQELLGQECIEFEHKVSPKKAICTSRSFGSMQDDYKSISEAVANFASRCAYKLRKQNSAANLILVFIHTNQHRKDLPQYSKSIVIKLDVATSSSMELITKALMGLKSIYKEGFKYKKAGVIVSGIVPDENVQLSLFDSCDRSKHTEALKVMDVINNKYGRDTLKVASLGFNRKWKLRQDLLSPSYTTNWLQILTVKV